MYNGPLAAIWCRCYTGSNGIGCNHADRRWSARGGQEVDQAGVEDDSGKIDTRLARKAKTIAEDKGISLSDYLSGITRGQIDRDWGKVLKKLAQIEEE